MQRWEYCNVDGTLTDGAVSGQVTTFTLEGATNVVVENGDLAAACARLGRDGWELVSVTRTTDLLREVLRTVYTFKRPLAAEEAQRAPQSTA